MEEGFQVFRQKRTDWIITWSQNKIRWVFFYFFVGLIAACLLAFLEEHFFPLPLSYLYKSVAVTVLIPCLTVLISILSTLRAHPDDTRDPSVEPEQVAAEGWLKRHAQPLLGVLMFAVWAAGYFAISYWTEGRSVHVLPTFRWEREVPFSPDFVWIYLTIYPTFVLPYFFIRQKEFFRLFSLAYITVMCICYLIYLVFPVTIQRPSFAVTSFSTWTLSIVYSADRPWNCFPSMHVAMSLLASLTILEVHRIRGLLTLLLTVCIAASTVLIKQHYVLDLLAAVAITLTIHFAYVRRRLLDTLFENFLRAEETVEKWINRKIDTRIWEALEGPLRARVTEMVRAILEESMPSGWEGSSAPDRSERPRRDSPLPGRESEL